MTELLRYLEIIHPDGTNQIVNLRDTAIKIGRAASNDIVLSDDKVSQWHCSITPSKEGYWIIRDGVVDRDSYRRSTNGTFLRRENQETIDMHKLPDGKEFLGNNDEIQIQGWKIVFRDPFRTYREQIGDTVKNIVIDKPNESIQDGYVFCLSQMKLYAIKGGNRQESDIKIRPKVRGLLECLTIENLTYGKPVVCTYENIAQFIWGSRSSDYGAEEIQGLARELRKIIGDEGLETVTGKGYTLKIGYEE